MELINSNTKKWVESYLSNPKATTIIETNNDSETGLQIAEYLYENLVNTKNVPMFKLELREKKSLGVAEVKEIKEYFSLKADSNEEYTRFAVITDAELLTNEAQNSLLKLIEELPERTILVLIVNEVSRILDTISSRCFTIKIHPLEYEKAKRYAKNQGIDDDIFNRAYLLSEGNSAVLMNYLDGDAAEIDELLEYSKEFISSDVYKRQIILTKLSKEDLSPLQFVKSIQLISKSTMRSSKTINNKLRWKEILENSFLAEEQLRSNVNSKLVLLNLSVSI